MEPLHRKREKTEDKYLDAKQIYHFDTEGKRHREDALLWEGRIKRGGKTKTATARGTETEK